VYQRLEEAQEPLLATGARARGWQPGQWMEGPRRVLWWSLLGAAGVVVLWVASQLSARRVEAERTEERIRRAEEDVEALGRFRRRGDDDR
jgi:hypothetical protein